MKSCFDFPTYLFGAIITEWISIEELSLLDKATCEKKKRIDYLLALNDWDCSQSTSTITASEVFVYWLVHRNIIVNSLHVHFCQQRDDIMKLCANSNSQLFDHIVSLSLDFCKLDESSVALCPSVCLLIDQCGVHLSTLHLVHSFMDDDELCLLFDKCERLTDISLKNIYKISDKSIEYMSNHCKALTKIEIAGFVVSDVSFQALANNCGPKLQSISVGDQADSTYDMLEDVSEQALVYFFSHCSSLTAATFTHTTISDAAIIALSLNCPQLKVFQLWNSFRVSDTGILAVAERCPLLETFDVANDDGVNLFPDTLLAVTSNCPALTELSVNALFELCLVPQIIQKCSHLRCVDLSCYGNLLQDDTATAEDICFVARHCGRQLEKLIITLAKSDDLTMRVVAEHCTNLLVLDISNNTDVTVVGVIDILQKCSHLTKLYCANITATPLELISAVEMHSVALEYLDLVKDCRGEVRDLASPPRNSFSGDTWPDYVVIRSKVRSTSLRIAMYQKKEPSFVEKELQTIYVHVVNGLKTLFGL